MNFEIDTHIFHVRHRHFGLFGLRQCSENCSPEFRSETRFIFFHRGLWKYISPLPPMSEWLFIGKTRGFLIGQTSRLPWYQPEASLLAKSARQSDAKGGLYWEVTAPLLEAQLYFMSV